MRKVLYPGSFDPLTKGHMNIIEQCKKLFDEIIISVGFNPNKKDFFFSKDERMQIINEVYKNDKQVKVISYTGASADAAMENNCIAIVRGIRSLTDFDVETQMATINKEISKNRINTICLFADIEYQFVSSTMVKEVFGLNKDILKYVDEVVYKKMLAKRSAKLSNKKNT